MCVSQKRKQKGIEKKREREHAPMRKQMQRAKNITEHNTQNSKKISREWGGGRTRSSRHQRHELLIRKLVYLEDSYIEPI